MAVAVWCSDILQTILIGKFKDDTISSTHISLLSRMKSDELSEYLESVCHHFYETNRTTIDELLNLTTIGYDEDESKFESQKIITNSCSTDR